MSSVVALAIFQILTIVASFVTLTLGIGELYAKKKKTQYHIKKMTLIVSGFTLFAAIGSYYFDNIVSRNKENETNYKIAIAEENISRNQLLSDSLRNELNKEKVNLEKEKLEREKLALQTLDLRNQNLELKIKLEQEESRRIELLNSLSPRALEQLNFSNYLKKYSNINLILECVDTEEAINTMGQLNVIFQLAGWKIQSKKITESNFMIRNDISIYRNVGVLPKEDLADEAADALMTQFKLNKIEASLFPEFGLPINTLKIVIGEKTNNYLMDWLMNGVRDRIDKIDTIKKEMLTYEKTISTELAQEYTLGFILFVIDKDNNIIPSIDSNLNYWKINWDKAKIAKGKNDAKILTPPPIVYSETGEDILYGFYEVTIENNIRTKSSTKGYLYNLGNINICFEVLDKKEYGLICVIGFN